MVEAVAFYLHKVASAVLLLMRVEPEIFLT
jgi:hypothetical protein